MALSTVELGSFANGSTGDTTVDLNGSETPKLIEFWVGPRTGTTETTNISSFGVVDITNGNATWQSNYTDGTGSQTKAGVGSSTASSCLQHYTRVSGTLTKIIDLEFVSATSGAFTLNILTANVNYSIFFRAYG